MARKATKAEMVDYIYHNFTRKGQKITKKELNGRSLEFLKEIIARNNCQRKFEEWLSRPTIQLTNFMVDGIKDGKELSWDCKYPSKEDCEKAFKEDGVTVQKIVPARGNHRCGYCQSITEGSNKDLLCGDCRDLLGHALYSEL